MWNTKPLYDDNTWAKQDLELAYALRNYGFTSIYRSQNQLLVGFDNGECINELPWFCFALVRRGREYTMDDLIARCGERCR